MTDPQAIAARLSEAIRRVTVHSSDITSDEGYYLGDHVTRLDLVQFRDDLAEAIATSVRAILEQSNEG